MAADKKATNLITPPEPNNIVGSSVGAPVKTSKLKEGQSFAERRAAGRVELALWVSTEVKDKLDQLVKVANAKHPKEIVEQAIKEMAAKYGIV